jgi:D-glycerate 3-kinase
VKSSWQKDMLASCDESLLRMLTLKLEISLEPALRQATLINDYYLPLFFYLRDQLAHAPSRPYYIGINAPQGAGKSTLSKYLVQLFGWCDLKAVALSIDDFYLTRAEQLRLARAYPDNPYLQQRGYPGTHDIALGLETLAWLKQPRTRKSIRLPRYDKSRHQGQGDRTARNMWPEVHLPVDVVLLEGWMLGFQPLPPGQLGTDTALTEINSLLAHYRSWHRFINSFIYLCPADPEYVVAWRSEAEERMKAQGLPGMSADEVRAYAEKFLPAYKLYGPALADQPPAANRLKITIGRDRLPVGS